MSNRRIYWLLLAILLALLTACGGTTSPDDDSGGGGNTGNPPAGGGDNDNGDSTPPSGGGGTDADTARLGSRDQAGNFNSGVITSNRTTLAAGENAALSVALVDSDGALLTVPASIAFTSPCIGDGLAGADPAIVDNSTGRINTTYTARGCDGEDTVTATTVVNATTLQATVSLQTMAAPPGSILFAGADPTAIGIRGAGGTLAEQSTVSFVVTNTTGGPVPNQPVDFNLSTQVGDIGLSNEQATTDANGRVSTTVSSGRVATPVRVRAQTVNPATGRTLTAQSNDLSITTGIADNDSFSLGAETPNIEGLDRDNATTRITALLSDRANNPVPDGTAVNFQAEGGSIDGSCTTEGGQCSVTFRSQNPRPDDGRVTILASAIGEESFNDTNGNGRHEAGEQAPENDLSEAFRDDNENGRRDGNETFLDFNDDQAYTGPSGDFTGVLCDSGCDEHATVNVRGSVVVVLSGSALNVTTRPNPIVLDGGIQTVTVTVLDTHGQVAPAGTTVAVETTQGALLGANSSSQTQDATSQRPTATSGVGRFTFRLEPEDEPGNGVFLITVTTPGGIISRGSATIRQPAP